MGEYTSITQEQINKQAEKDRAVEQFIELMNLKDLEEKRMKLIKKEAEKDRAVEQFIKNDKVNFIKKNNN